MSQAQHYDHRVINAPDIQSEPRGDADRTSVMTLSLNEVDETLYLEIKCD